MLTSTPEAIVMVLEALRGCGSLELHGVRVCWGCAAAVDACHCPPSAREPLARAALGAWDRRERLRDDAKLRELLGGYAPVSADLDRLCDIAEARLFGRGAGTDTKGTP